VKKKKSETPIGPRFLTAGHLVLHGGLPCTVVNISGLRKGGLLLPGEPVAMFGTLRDARRAITRTQSAVKHLRGSLVEEWARTKAPLLFSGGEYTLAPLGRQT